MRHPWIALLLALALAGPARAQAPQPQTGAGEPAAPAAEESLVAPAPPPRPAAETPPQALPQTRPARSDAPLDRASEILAPLWQRLAVIWDGLTERDELPTLLVLFNGLLVLFTYRLWRSTAGLRDAAREQSQDMKLAIASVRDAAAAARQSAEAALLQARTAIGVELPRLELSDVRLRHADESVRQALASPSVDLRFTNHGRTAAFITQKCVELRVVDALPAEPIYRAVERLEVVEPIDRGDGTDLSAPRRLGDLGEQQVTQLLAGRSTLWVYGFVSFRDFLSTAHRKGFCLRWLPPARDAGIGGTFLQEGPERYVDERQETGHEPVEIIALPRPSSDAAPQPTGRAAAAPPEPPRLRVGARG
jgi:hypothetical protein